MLGGRAVPLLWIAAFACLYGVRLLIRTDTFRFYADTSPATWDYADAAITYTVPVPIVLFARSIFPTWRRFWTIGAVGLTAFGAYAITSDAILQEPFSAAAASNLIAIAFFVGVLAWILRPGLAHSHEVRAMRVGVVAVSLAAVADNLRGIGGVAFPVRSSSRSASPSSLAAWQSSRSGACWTTPSGWWRSIASWRSPDESSSRSSRSACLGSPG